MTRPVPLDRPRRGLLAATVLAAALGVAALAAAGCEAKRPDLSGIQADFTFDPSPPVKGPMVVELRLSDPQGRPVEKATVRLEGNMNHAGMRASLAELDEIEPGRYAGTLDFTMGGDWFVTATVFTTEGGRVERTIDVPGVQSR